MKATHVPIYSDEVGPTGLDLLNRDQPFFIATYLIIDNEETVTNQLNDVFKDSTRPAELKFTKLGSSSAGMRAVIGATKSLLDSGTSVHVSLTEKRFQACTLAVETFLDAASHPRVIPQFELMEWRTWLANEIHNNITDNILIDLTKGIKENNKSAIQQAGTTIANRLALHHNPETRIAAEFIREGIATPYEFGDTDSMGDSSLIKPLPTSPVSSFLAAVMQLNSALSKRGQTGEIVCDTDLQSGPALNQALKLANDPKFFDAFLTEFTGPTSQPPASVTGRSERDSKHSIPIQLADIVAGLINRVATTRLRSTSKLESKLSKVWNNIHPCVAKAAPDHFVMISNKTQERGLLSPSP